MGMNKMRHFKKIKDTAIVGGIAAMIVFVLHGCDANQSSSDSSVFSESAMKGAYVLLEEQADGSYRILEEYPSSGTRIVVRDREGNERLLSSKEVEEIVKKEAQRVDSGTSELLSPAPGGLGLGGAILASAAGAILGSYIGNRLFNNPNYLQNQQRNYKSPQAYERSKNSFKNVPVANRTQIPARSGFFKTQAQGTSLGS